jgi:hypothetical protein
MNTPEWNECIELLANSVKDKPIIRGSQPNRVAVILEPRDHPVVYNLLRWTIHLLAPEGWRFIVYVGTNTAEKIQNLVTELEVEDWVTISHLGRDNLTTKEYSNIFMSPLFWENIPQEHILIFQSDSVLLDGKLDQFLSYDYVGAPWSDYMVHLIKLPTSVGNGGLSLRRKSGMLRAINSKFPMSRKMDGYPEDLYFAYRRRQLLNIPSAEVAIQFSVEGKFYESPRGYHKPWIYMPENMESIYARIKSKTN